MKIPPLILDCRVEEKIRQVRAHAEVHRWSIQDIFDIMGGRRSPPGDDPNFVCLVPLGYRCVFTIEQLPELGWCRHLSVSLMGPAGLPNPGAVKPIAEAFGFVGVWQKMDAIQMEQIAPAKSAVNVIQRIALADPPAFGG